MNSDNPILNSPYEEPEWHYATEVNGSVNFWRQLIYSNL